MIASPLRWLLSLPVLLYQSIALALAQIWMNKLRGFLTTVGIMIGVAAISAVIALINGMKQRVLAEFDAFGTNKVFVTPQWTQKQLKHGAWDQVCFRNDLFDELLEKCPSIVRYERDAGYGGIPVTYRTHSEYDKLQFSGVDEQWHAINRRGVLVGRPLTLMDTQEARRVCLINAKLRDRLNLDRDPTGSHINVFYFGRLQVIGVVEQPIAFSGSESEMGEVIVPFGFSTTRYPYPTWYDVVAEAKSREVMDDAKAEIEFYMRQKRRVRPGEEDTFAVHTPEREIKEINEMAGVVTTFAAGIVGISLLVGGVGIMNIMLVSVSERTREIGLRKAVGAKPMAVLLQFLIEAVVLCLVGGAMGLLFGQLLTSAVAMNIPANPQAWDAMAASAQAPKDQPVMGAMSILLPPAAIFLAFGFSALVGVVFGMFPAIKAAALDPIEALRHE